MTFGAYGYTLTSGDFDEADLQLALATWPHLHVVVGGIPPTDWAPLIDGPGWAVHVQPGGAGVQWVGDTTWDDADARLHPLLSLVSIAATLERGGDSWHASAVLIEDGVVAVFAPGGGGKTTTVAWLALHGGVQAFTDDNLTVHGGLAHAGPRSLDLRPSGAAALGVEDSTRLVRDSERRRLRLPRPDRVSAPVVRTVLLEWGERVCVERVPPRERMAVLATQRTAQPVPGSLTVPLELAAVPMLRVTRPRTTACLPDVADAVLGG